MKKGVISVNSNAEKTIIAMKISVVLAIIFDGKKKKPSGDEPEEQPQQSLEEMREIDYLMDSES